MKTCQGGFVIKIAPLFLALSIVALPCTANAQTEQKDCSEHVGDIIAIAAAPLTEEDVGGRYDANADEAKIGALRYDWGLLLQTDDPRFAHVDAVSAVVRSANTGCWLGGDFIRSTNGVVTGIDNARIVADPYHLDYVRPQPEHPAPQIAGYRYIEASKSYNRAYPWIGLWAAEGEQSQTTIAAFNANEHVVLATLPYQLTVISTLPSPDTSWTGIAVAGAGLGEPSPYLRLRWWTRSAEAQGTRFT